MLEDNQTAVFGNGCEMNFYCLFAAGGAGTVLSNKNRMQVNMSFKIS